MNNMMILLIKFVAAFLAFAIAFDLFFDATFVDILSFSILITVVSYFVGDRLILPRIGNVKAAIVDFFMTYTLVWIFGSILLHSYLQIAWGSIISATLIAGGEVLIHNFIQNRTANTAEEKAQTKTNFNPRLAYGTEFAEEDNPREKK
ncbi:YndM family protein [Bacillus sp. 31A1R]|uniref:YndM family protein n=1 Tax=Robertmurraya mangrovi TaxID=3098077 RepID=A0ABU5IWN4_9BACI|nr:YndM family protein [Bacillus sp. 31A1R]MDZ5471546.1 YndM family protein [Bacillus sp. 31A1R]